jgi:hypothetical protein
MCRPWLESEGLAGSVVVAFQPADAGPDRSYTVLWPPGYDREFERWEESEVCEGRDYLLAFKIATDSRKQVRAFYDSVLALFPPSGGDHPPHLPAGIAESGRKVRLFVYTDEPADAFDICRPRLESDGLSGSVMVAYRLALAELDEPHTILWPSGDGTAFEHEAPPEFMDEWKYLLVFDFNIDLRERIQTFYDHVGELIEGQEGDRPPHLEPDIYPWETEEGSYKLIALATDDPCAAFRLCRPGLDSVGLVGSVFAAYGRSGGDPEEPYIALWPPGYDPGRRLTWRTL